MVFNKETAKLARGKQEDKRTIKSVNGQMIANDYWKYKKDPVFVKQLLTALAYMHSRGIVHLDLKPNVILLQDDHLRLADFGQSRRLINGKLLGGAIKSNLEFVSPEIVAGTETVTLAVDMWSVGALTYVLLFGQSPFLGDNDEETLQNILKGEFQIDESNKQISSDAYDFIKKLLVLDPHCRLTVQQALTHNWLSDPSLDDAKLSTDCLREVKYRHQWLEHRIFVQRTNEMIEEEMRTDETLFDVGI